MKIHYSRISPTGFEFISLIFIDFLVVVLSNTKSMLEYYGLHNTTQLVHESTGATISTGLSKVDNLKFTDTLVTFMIWAIIGIVCFSLVQGIARIYGDIRQDRQLASNRYVQPENFNRQSFWHQVLLDFGGVLACLSLIFASLFVFLAYVLPVSINQIRPFLLGVSLSGLGHAIFGVVVVYAWLAVFCTLLKLFINRHRLAASSH